MRVQSVAVARKSRLSRKKIALFQSINTEISALGKEENLKKHQLKGQTVWMRFSTVIQVSYMSATLKTKEVLHSLLNARQIDSNTTTKKDESIHLHGPSHSWEVGKVAFKHNLEVTRVATKGEGEDPIKTSAMVENEQTRRACRWRLHRLRDNG